MHTNRLLVHDHIVSNTDAVHNKKDDIQETFANMKAKYAEFNMSSMVDDDDFQSMKNTTKQANDGKAIYVNVIKEVDDMPKLSTEDKSAALSTGRRTTRTIVRKNISDVDHSPLSSSPALALNDNNSNSSISIIRNSSKVVSFTDTMSSLLLQVPSEETLPVKSLEDRSDELLQYFQAKLPIPPPLLALPKLTLPAVATENSVDDTILNDFNKQIEPKSLNISTIPMPQLLEERDKIIQEKELQQRLLLEKRKEIEVDQIWRENIARQRVVNMQNIAKKKILLEKEKLADCSIDSERRIARDFKRARENLEDGIRKQFASIRERFGDFVPQFPHSMSSNGSSALGRKFEVLTKHEPEPIEVRVHILRAIKTKLPEGNYVIMISQYDKVGGKMLNWSKIDERSSYNPDRPIVTRSVHHKGRYFDRVMRMEDSCYTLCPSRDELKPSYCLMLELYHLADKINPYDQVVGWAVLPMCNELFNVIEGKFRIPFMRGEFNPTIQHYKSIEKEMSQDIGSWLCNGYIEIRRCPLNKFDSTTGATSGNAGSYKSVYELDYLNKSVTTATSAIKQKPQFANDELLESGLKVMKKPVTDSRQSNDNRQTSSVYIGVGNDGSADQRHLSDSQLSRSIKMISNDTNTSNDNSNSSEGNVNSSNDNSIYERMRDADEESHLHPEQLGKLFGIETIDSHSDRKFAFESIETTSHDDHVSRMQYEGLRLDCSAIGQSHRAAKNADTSSSSSSSGSSSVWEPLVDEDEINSYSTSIAYDPSRKKRLLPTLIARTKMKFIVMEIFGDLSPALYGSLEFNVTLFLMLFSFWFRIYIHYVGEYLLLSAYYIPVTSFSLKAFTVMFKYPSSIPASVEVGIVAVGPVLNVIVYTVLITIAYLSNRYAKCLPDGVSKFLASYGVCVVLDPLLTLFVDICYGYFACRYRTQCIDNYNSNQCQCFTPDFEKLWYRYSLDESSGFSGLIITFIVYMCSTVLSSLLLYVYIVYIHYGARILDTWRRINCNDEDFFIPNDYEISSGELNSLLLRARKWRGGDGSTRRVIVKTISKDDSGIDDIISNDSISGTDPLTYYGIYEVSLDESVSRLYRHFIEVLSPRGGIIEIFGNASVGAFADSSKAAKRKLAVFNM